MLNLDHLDLNITTQCNFRCVSCSHASPFSDPYHMKVETAVRDLESLSKFVHLKMVCAVGGEPTISPNLLTFLDAMKASGIADQVCVITNGSRLDKMAKEFWQKIDILRVSIYQKLDPKILETAQAASLEYGFELQAWPYPEFFQQLKAVPDDGQESFNQCPYKTDCYTVHEGHFYLCPQSAFFPKRFMGLDENVDGLALDGMTDESLDKFMNRTNPLSACRICMGGHKISKPWEEAKNKLEWIEKSTFKRFIPNAEETARMSE